MGHQETTKQMIQQKLAQSQLDEAMRNAKAEHLTRLVTVQLGTLDTLCQQAEHDKLTVAANTLCIIAVRGQAKREELLKMAGEVFDDQAAKAAQAAPALITPT